jgi:multidrug efflux pump subunit AcrA (membrane-fusion protein)
VRQRLRQSSADGDRPALAQAVAQLEQVRAERALIDQKLGRTRLLAPFDGVVVSGDLSQSLGRPVDKGEVLFEIAPLSSYRLRMQIDERDVSYVEVGQRGSVVLTALLGSTFEVQVTRLTPVSEVSDGRNVFVAEAQLVEANAALRPGMEGVAKIDAGRRSLGWIWTRRALDWVRLAVWRWLP